jgi:hypothetical protein
MNAPAVFKLAGGPLVNPGEPGAEASTQADAPQALPRAGAQASAARRPASFSAFVPTLLTTLTLMVWFSAQLLDAYQQRQNLLAAHTSQQQTVDNAGKLRQSLDVLAADTQRMADAGNGNAALLVAELRKRGITISVPGAAAAVAPVSAPAVPASPRP